MNIFNNKTNEEIQKIQMDLETPLLKDSDRDPVGKLAVEIHSAIPLAEEADDENDEDMTIIDDSCSVLNRTYGYGFLLGLFFQACSLYAVTIAMPTSQIAGVPTQKAEKTEFNHDLGVPTLFALYIFARYWVVVALVLPPMVTAIVQKRSRAKHCKGNNGIAAKVRGNFEAFFECLRFQFGVFFGSLILLSLVNFYAIAKTAPLGMLLVYYAVCAVVSFFALILLQIFVNQICAHVSSVEIIVNYSDDEDDDEDEDSRD